MMSQAREDIIKGIQQHIIGCIAWGEKNLKISLLILHVDYTFSKRRSTSFVSTGFLENQMFLSLQLIEKLRISGGKELFEESHERTERFEGTQSFLADWRQYYQALIAHEMAHVFETMARYEPFSQSHINSYYNHQHNHSRRYHHNLLWRKVYRDLRCSVLPDSKNTFLINKSSGFDCYFRSGDTL